MISKNPDFLAARALIGWQVVALGLVLVLVPPLLALGVGGGGGPREQAAAGPASPALHGTARGPDRDSGPQGHRPERGSAALITVASMLALAAVAGYARA